MSGHTPGPWTFSFESVDPEWAIVTTPGGAIIANVNADHRQEANARLIAAAPDLLEALILAREFMVDAPDCIDTYPSEIVAAEIERVNKIEAAIAKASPPSMGGA